jgi:hypothetical protein
MAKPWVKIMLLLGFLFVACGSPTPTDVYRTVTEPTLRPGDAVPRPTGPVVLSLTGKIGQTNVDDRLDFDLATLEQLGLVEYEVDDPLLKTMTPRGVLLKNVLDVAKIAPDAKELFASAHNLYTTTIPLDVMKWPIVIATMRNGKRIPAEERGPIEIVFPNRHYNIDEVTYNKMWVWQLESFDVR